MEAERRGERKKGGRERVERKKREQGGWEGRERGGGENKERMKDRIRRDRRYEYV